MNISRVIILNPQARSGKSRVRDQFLKELSGENRVEFTDRPGSAALLAAKAAREGIPTVVAAGGDGTIHEVVQGLAGTSVTLGILPTGTLNVLARDLGISMDLHQAWRVVQEGYSLPVDLVKVELQADGGATIRWMIQLGGAGLDARAVTKVSLSLKKICGPLSYVWAALQVGEKDLPMLKMKLDGRPMECRSFLMGNGRMYGGPFKMFKRASMQDGKMDFLLFQSTHLAGMLFHLGQFMLGGRESNGSLVYQQGATMECFSDAPVPIEIDGELAGWTPARLTVMPQALRVLVPSCKKSV